MLVSCPNCNAQLDAPADAVGKRATCRKCGNKFQIQAAESELVLEEAGAPVFEKTASPLVAKVTAESKSSFHKQRIAILACAGVGMLASFLPWVQTSMGSGSGVDGWKGWLSLCLFVPAIVLGLRGNHSTPVLGNFRFGAVIPAALATVMGLHILIGLNVRNDPSQEQNAIAKAMKISFDIHAGIGLYLLILAGITMIVSAWLLAKPAI
jgi:hypothetical protein